MNIEKVVSIVFYGFVFLLALALFYGLGYLFRDSPAPFLSIAVCFAAVGLFVLFCKFVYWMLVPFFE